MAGDPKFEASQELPDFPYAGYAELLGLRGHPRRPTRAGRRRRGTRRSPPTGRSCSRPSPIREVPPLPPHITLEQAKALMSALLKAIPNAGRIIRQSFKQKVQEFLPGR